MKRASPYEFTWDEDKAIANERKHGITFAMGISTEDAINDILRRHLGLPSELPEPAPRG